ncbi:MAG: CPBP family intramembrane glutamic endopeptidase [Caulobacterales bacterium]
MSTTVMNTIDVVGTSPDVEKHSLVRSIVLHLFPGAAMVLAYLAAMPFARQHGLPPLLVSCLSALLVMAPLEIAHLFLLGRKATGAWSLSPAVNFPAPMRAWRYALIVLGLAVATIAIYGVVQPADRWFARTFMGWLPNWFDFSDVRQYARLGRDMLLLTLAARFVADVLVVSAVEELYFRGYLLPRMPGPAWLAPILNTALFAIYHFWQPYNWLSIFCFLLPTVVVVWWVKDVRIGVYAHVTLNLIGFISFAVAVLGH